MSSNSQTLCEAADYRSLKKGFTAQDFFEAFSMTKVITKIKYRMLNFFGEVFKEQSTMRDMMMMMIDVLRPLLCTR